MPETAIFDHYEVMTRDDGSLFELGRGAMGVTYKAFDTSLRIPVALKVINAAYLNSEVARQRFIREARSAAKLRHRHVASVFHLGTEGETWFYAMEFIDGETLDALIKRQGTLNPVVALTITAQVARALNAASQHGLVHRDIKPSNLMLVKEDEEIVAKVIDFGLAKTSVAGEGEDAVTLSMGGFVGTPHFASPEQLEEKEIDTRSDIYSLGVTLWYMLAGQAPFAGSMAQVMSQHLSKPPPFEKLDHLPAVVADVLRKMLAKDPTERFQTAADLRKAIEEALEQVSDTPAASAPVVDSEMNFATLIEDSSTPSGMGSFETNTIIANRYRVAESLGETNTGHLFHAYDTERKRDVRLIVLPTAALVDSAALTGLEREVERLANVRHPNLLGVFDFETVDRGTFLVLEWTVGFSLLDLLKARRELGADETLPLFAQAAAGVDHALSLGLNGVEFGLHQILLHFPQPIEKDKLLHTPVSQWPPFELKLYPLGATQNIATSQTWAGAQTMVGGGSHGDAGEADARPRYVQTLAAVIYELLGGTLSPLTLRGAGPTMRYTPLSTLSEEGNEVLRRALDPGRSFPTATAFYEALNQLRGLQVSRREPKSAPAPKPPSSAPVRKAPVPPAAPFVPPEPKKFPIALIGGVAAVITAGAVAFFTLNKPAAQPGPGEGVTPSIEHASDSPPITNGGELPPMVDATPIAPPPIVTTPKPVSTPAPPTRQELLMAAVKSAQALEEDGDWDKSLAAWLGVAREYPESPVGRTHLETLLNRLRQPPSTISPEDFQRMRAMIAEAAELDVLAAMLLLAENTREQDPATAFRWYSAAAEKDYGPAWTQVGLLLSKGKAPIEHDDTKAAEAFKNAAHLGDHEGKLLLGDCYLSGKGVDRKDENRALELFRESADAGNVFAMNRLGDCFTRGVGGQTDFGEAFRLFTKASDRGNLEALGNLGVLYINGQGVPAPDQKKAATLFEKGARGGNAFCMFLYAQCLENGVGIGKNMLQAQSWYRKAAEAGNTRAAEWCRNNSLPFTPR